MLASVIIDGSKFTTTQEVKNSALFQSATSQAASKHKKYSFDLFQSREPPPFVYKSGSRTGPVPAQPPFVPFYLLLIRGRSWYRGTNYLFKPFCNWATQCFAWVFQRAVFPWPLLQETDAWISVQFACVYLKKTHIYIEIDIEIYIYVCACVDHLNRCKRFYLCRGMAAVSLAMPMKLWDSAGRVCGCTLLCPQIWYSSTPVRM